MLPRIFPPDNSPESLLKIVVKYIVSNDIPIKYVSLPTEICNTLLEVFRDLNANNPSNTNDPGKVTRFISQFRADSTPLSVAKLSNLPITDRDLLHLLCEHHNTLKYLDIDGCRDLTENSFPTLLTLSSRLDNYDRLIVNVKLTEQDGERQDASMVSPSSSSVEGSDLICFSDSLEDISHDGDSVKTYSYSKALLDKKYERGVITSNLGICESTHVGYKQDLLSIFEAMDVFQYGFEQLRRDLSSINEDSGLISDVTDSQRIDMNDTPQKIFYHSESSPCERIRLSNTSNQEPTISSYILSTFEFPEINSGHLVEKTSTGKFRHLKYQTYRLPPLETLIIGSSNIFPRAREWKRLVNKEKIDPHLPLKAFVLHGPDPHSSQFISDSILDLIVSSSMNQTLTYLDLSSCGALTISSPLKLENLKTLILYNTQISLSCLKSLKKLRYLDISTSFERQAHSYESPDSTLAELVTSLPELTHLDISGTNLTGERSNRIVGLESRYNRPLEFLGVYNTANDGSFRHCLPALRVAGEATEEHILTACEVYMDRSEFLTKALNDLFHCFRHESEFHDIVRSLNCVLTAMERHLEEKPIQIAASASLFYMVKSEDAKNYSPLMKRPIVSRLLDAMHRFQNDSTMLRNGSLTMIHFKLPHDVLFEYPRVVKLLLFIVMNEEEEFIQRLGIYLLNSLVCHVDRGQKTLVGDLGAIEKLVKLIRNKLAKNQCDEVMEIAWSTIWNVTDENPTNCERFLDNLGMDLFVRCMEAFPDPPDLLRNMMGLLGNVAECETLRPRLMEADYITRFSNLLASESDGIEVSYNAAGILSHIVSDGEEVWNQLLSKTDRADILYRMRMAIGRWQINSRRNINYRSFEPILRLLKTEKPVYEAQYWAVWALANLTRVYSPKYCPLLIADGGVKILETLLQDKQLPSHVRKLAVLTLQQIELWKRYASLGALENSTSIEIDLNRC